MRKGDKSFCTYRGHAHTLARGASMEGMLGELMLRDIGLMRGKGGSMHLTSVEHDVLGSYAIIGAHLPIACGSAWRAQYLGEKDVSVCFFGDGTTNIGAFHEALNFAAVWKLPVVFVCENNLYMEYTPIGEVTAVKHPAADRAAAYGLERIVIDGNDADVVYRTAQAALDKGARRRRPVAHRVPDLPPFRPFARRSRQIPAAGRTGGMAEARSGDHLSRSASRTSASREETIDAIEAESRRKVEAATDACKASPPAPVELLTRGCLRGWRLGVAELTYRDAVARGIAQEMERDNRVVFLGEDVAQGGRRVQGDGRPLRAVRPAARARHARSPNRRSSARQWARR